MNRLNRLTAFFNSNYSVVYRVHSSIVSDVFDFVWIVLFRVFGSERCGDHRFTYKKLTEPF